MGVYSVKQLTGDLWSIDEGGVRCFLLAGDSRALLLDTGFGKGDLRAEVEKLTDKPVTVVNTHADPDHIGCNAQFEEVWMHPAEFDRFASRGAPGPEPKALWEGAELDIGAWKLEAVLIPGHTPGSIALLDRRRRVLFSGDSVQAGPIFMFGPGRNFPAFLASMEKLRELREAFDTVYQCHNAVSCAPGVIDDLIDGARLWIDGKLPRLPSGRPAPAPQFICDSGKVKFFV